MPPALNVDGTASGTPLDLQADDATSGGGGGGGGGGSGGGGSGGGRKVAPAADEASSLPHAEAVSLAVETPESMEQNTPVLATSGTTSGTRGTTTTSVMATGEFRSTNLLDSDGLAPSYKKQTKVR